MKNPHSLSGFALAVVFAFAGPTANAQVGVRPNAAQLIAAWEEANGRCRGGSGDSPRTLQACKERESLGDRLETMGYCYGKRGEFGYQASWHRCTSTSCGIVDC